MNDQACTFPYIMQTFQGLYNAVEKFKSDRPKGRNSSKNGSVSVL